MLYSVELVPKDPPWRTEIYSYLAEKLGFYSIWMSDHYHNRNVFVSLSKVALSTSSIKIGPGVTNPYLYNPVTIAQSVASISELAPNRVMLGIGAGDATSLGSLGIERREPIKRVKECVKLVRKLLKGEEVNGNFCNLTLKTVRLSFLPRGDIPIYLGAQGPMMLRLAGMIADGVLINASTPEEVRYCVEHVVQGIKDSGRNDKMDVCAQLTVSIYDDREKAKKTVKPYVAYIVSGASDRILEEYGIGKEFVIKIREKLLKQSWDELYPLIDDHMVDSFSVCGKPEECLDKIIDICKDGVSHIIFGSPLGPRVRWSMEVIVNQIIPKIEEVTNKI